MNLHGWCGKILDIDLSNRRVTHIETVDYANRFLGGRGIATRLYWEQVAPQTSAFDPENRLIFMTGPLSATGAQGASRFEVVGKSPMLLPEGFCYGNLGGYFGPTLKKAGYDGIVIHGKAEGWVYLLIRDASVEIRDASELKGKGVYAVRERLKNEHGKTLRLITTGPAGEHLCRTANILTDNEGSATGGFGAVMGSKNLKAVAVMGSGKVPPADPEALSELNRLTVQLNQGKPQFNPFPPDQISRVGKSACYQCGLDCVMRNRFRTSAGREFVRKCQAMFVYFPWVMARGNEPAETAADATGMCNDLSLCTMEMYNLVTFLQKGFEAGILTRDETGLDISQLGTRPFFESLATMIAFRQGFGDLLAEGLLRADQKLGPKAHALFANEVSGVGDGATYSAREYLMNGLLYAFEPRQPIAMLHEISRIIGLWVMNRNHPGATPVTNSVFRSAASRFWGHEQAWDLMTTEGKAQAATRIIDRTVVKDSLGLCDSCWPLMVSWHTPDHVGDPTLESRTYNAVTGNSLDEPELRFMGERIFNQERAILVREGLQPLANDDLAEFNFTDPVQSVFMNPDVIVPGPGDEVLSRKGMCLARSDFETMRREFYELRGWEPATGRQKKETLEKLDLTDLATDSL